MPDDKLADLHKTDPIACHVLKTIDSCVGLNFKSINGSVLAAVFLSVLKDGAQALDFWMKYSNAKGNFVDGSMDAVMMATTYYDEIATIGRSDYTGNRPNYILSGSSREVHPVHTPMFLSYYNAYKQQKNFVAKKKAYGYERTRTKLTVNGFLNNKSYKEFVGNLLV